MARDIEELKKKQAEDLRRAELAAEAEQQVAAKLGDEFPWLQVYVYQVHGVELGLKIGTIEYGRQPDRALKVSQVITAMEALPPVSMGRYKYGWTSFQPLQVREEFDSACVVDPIGPAYLEINATCTPQHGHTPDCEWHWFTELDGRLCDVSAVMSVHRVAQVHFEFDPAVPGELRRVRSTKVSFVRPWVEDPSPGPTLLGPDGKPMERIAFGGGSSESGHRMRYYTMDPEADFVAWFKTKIWV